MALTPQEKREGAERLPEDLMEHLDYFKASAMEVEEDIPTD